MKLYKEMPYSVDRYNFKLNILQDKANLDKIILLCIYIILYTCICHRNPFKLLETDFVDIYCVCLSGSLDGWIYN